MAEYLRGKSIEHISVGNHSFLTEAYIFKLKRIITKYILHHNTERYLDHLQDLVVTANNTYHRALGTTPNEAWHARGDQRAQIFMNQYFDPERFKKKKPDPKKLTKYQIKQKLKNARARYHFRITDVVRISLDDGDPLTHKGYRINWSNEVYSIQRRRMLEGVDYYWLKTSKNEVMENSFHYSELQKVIVPEDKVFKISKIIKRKRIGREMWCYVNWTGFSNRENSWIRQRDIVDI